MRTLNAGCINMPRITLEQALFVRPDGAAARLVKRSPGFLESWLAEAEALAHGFGEKPSSAFRCPPLMVFAKPIRNSHVAVVRVRDDHGGASPGLRFHFLIVDRNNYESWIRDPFILAAKVEPTWDTAELPAIAIATETFVPRTVAEVQRVLKRIKAAALKEGDDPESPDFERTIENSESPVLLGGAQILVDGGRLVFERSQGDLAMVSGLWLLLPEATRTRLWPTSFAFSPALEFDVLVLPHIKETVLESYTTEEQAADYPQGTYELALQRAVESGDQREMDAVFSRRDGWQTVKLAVALLALLSLLVLASRWLETDKPVTPTNNPVPVALQPAVGAAGIVGVGELWPSVSMVAGWHKLKHDAEKAREQK